MLLSFDLTGWILEVGLPFLIGCAIGWAYGIIPAQSRFQAVLWSVIASLIAWLLVGWIEPFVIGTVTQPFAATLGDAAHFFYAYIALGAMMFLRMERDLKKKMASKLKDASPGISSE